MPTMSTLQHCWRQLTKQRPTAVPEKSIRHRSKPDLRPAILVLACTMAMAAIFASSASARPLISMDFGQAFYGYFATPEQAPIESYPFGISLLYETAPSGTRQWQGGAALRFATISYVSSGTKKDGLYIASGVRIGMTDAFNRGLKVTYSGAYYPLATMAVASVSQGVINGNPVESSSLMTFSGGSGLEFTVEPVLNTKLDFLYGAMMSYGLRGTLVYQKFNHYKSQTRFSDASRVPAEGTSSEANNLLLLMALGLVITYPF